MVSRASGRIPEIGLGSIQVHQRAPFLCQALGRGWGAYGGWGALGPCPPSRSSESMRDGGCLPGVLGAGPRQPPFSEPGTPASFLGLPGLPGLAARWSPVVITLLCEPVRVPVAFIC